MTNEYSAKYGIGDKVKLIFGVNGQTVTSDIIYTVEGYRFVKGSSGANYAIYNLLTPDGNPITGFLESKLVPAESPTGSKFINKQFDGSPVYVDGKYIAPPPTSDELLDDYSDYMSLYAITGLDEYLDLANETRAEWERLFGKKQGTKGDE